MPFGAVQTLFFPVAANAGSSLWGSDVRKLITPADAGNDASTKFAMTTNTSAHTVTADPYTSQASDLTQADYGWAIDPADMNSVSGAQRVMAAGNHVGTLRLQSTTGTNPNGSLTMFVYRVGDAAGGRVRTLLGSATVTGQTFDTTIRTYTITVALGQIIFGVDETIQYSFELNGQGVALTGKNNSFYTGTISGTPAQIDFPTLGVTLPVTGFTPSVSFGTPTLTVAALEVHPSGFTPSVDFGTPAVTHELDVAGFAPTVDFGAPTLRHDLDVSGFAPTVDFGTPTLVEVLAVDGFTPVVDFGDPTVTVGQVLTVDGFTPDVTFGATTLSTQPVVAGTVFNHETGEPVGAGVVVKLFNQDDILVDTGVTAADGTYVFFRPVGDTDTYFVLASFEISGVQYHGVSDSGCPAV